MKNIYDDTMNNNEPDYEGNLAFPPQEESVEKKCEKLERQLTYAIQALEMYEIQQDFTPVDYHCFAEDTLREIKELDK